MVIADSSVWVDAFRDRNTPQAQALWDILAEERVGVCDLVLCEVLQGARSESEFRHIRQTLLALDVFEVADVPTAISAAQNYRLLRTKGVTIRRTVDCLIATFCIREGHTLLHSDRDFDPFEEHLGLRVLH
ncbi:MAG: PIN domain nuclease [Armatimonadetes bacterium]|nr:PIN domain nuclease [Armatimonadota bacterium]